MATAVRIPVGTHVKVGAGSVEGTLRGWALSAGRPDDQLALFEGLRA